ncbi:hypothetical protein KC317_g20267, partial [Hortaea werneckii]
KEKSSRSKDGSTSPVKERPGISRSKSSRKAAEKDSADKASRSSGSDKGEKSASKSRPSTSRGAGLGAMFGVGTPVESKSKRDRPSTSRRHSTAVDQHGMMSPPPEHVGAGGEMSDKAAKLMGVSRSKSTRDRKQRKVPDPYALDSDDMVMVDAPEDSAKDVPSERRERKSRRPKRESTMMSGGLGEGDDAVMVDAPRGSQDRADDFTYDARPPLIRRATTTAKAGIMGGLLGALGARPNADKRQSKVYESEDGMGRRKRGSAYEDDQSKRLRREDRKVGRSRRSSNPDAMPEDAPMDEAEDPAAREAKEARRAERRARRDRLVEEEARAERRREREVARRAKAMAEEDRVRQEDEEREARRREERRARRAERETRRAEEDRIAAEEEAKAAERRARRHERERQRAEIDDANRPKAERRRSERPEDEEARRIRHEERRMRHEKDRPHTSRRRSDYPAPAGDYFDRRNGEHPPYADGVAASPHADGAP